MNDFVARYVDAAERHGKSTERGTAMSANRAHDQLMEALRGLRAMPDRGEAGLLELISHQSDWVREWASTHLLPLAEARALATLEELTNAKSAFVRVNAKMVLREWRAGRLKVP
jgi:hypothetical protein